MLGVQLDGLALESPQFHSKVILSTQTSTTNLATTIDHCIIVQYDKARRLVQRMSSNRPQLVELRNIQGKGEAYTVPIE